MNVKYKPPVLVNQVWKSENWMGLDVKGVQLKATHDMMCRNVSKWIARDVMDEAVSVTVPLGLFSGARLVRGELIKNAIDAGWPDLAAALDIFLNKTS